ncbi:MAG: phosphoribosylformylglycinamidine synthase subunit PurL [Vulcanimicrobiaceae bacterium]
MPKSLALRDDELRSIAERLGREPSSTELHAFDAQWSEHCSYKSSRHLLGSLPTNGEAVVLGPGEDSGILHLGEWNGERYGIVIAHESHNHPSQVVPFEGAATGIGGIVRDIVCMGAEVIALADPLRFGRIDDPASHQRYVAQGVVDGISAYGNAIGVPNIAGDLYFDERFDDNCLVNVVAIGLVKESEIIHSFAPPGADGWDIVLVGKATDASGFGGASFSSVTLDADDEDANKGAVQVPDPFLKNVLMRASYRVFAMLRERKITVGFKDLGAGGIMGCSAEMCSSGGFGADIQLRAVNVAIEGLPAEVVAVGETQERLLWVLPQHITPEVLRIYNQEFTLPEIARNAGATAIGTVTARGQYVLRDGQQTVMDVPIDFLTGSIRDELPFERLEAPVPPPGRAFETGVQLDELLERVLAHHDVCSREPLYRRYDGVVRGRSVLARGEADAGVVAPVPGAPFGMALSVDGNPRMSKIDPHLAAQHAVYEAVRNVVAVGARPIGLTDCLNFGNPRKIDHYSELVAAIDGLGIAACAFATPFVSGNVSLYNESKNGRAIPASPIIACVGAIDDIAHIVTLPLKRPGSVLYLLGTPQRALGGSVLIDVVGKSEPGLPQIDYEAARAHNGLLLQAARAGMLRSAHDISDGGLAVTICEMAFGSLGRGRAAVGVQLDDTFQWTQGEVGDLEALFGEAGGFVVEIAGADIEAFEALADGVEGVHEIGVTIDRPVIAIGPQAFDLHWLHEIWSQSLAGVYA